jgi:hypothetical protein
MVVIQGSFPDLRMSRTGGNTVLRGEELVAAFAPTAAVEVLQRVHARTEHVELLERVE